MKAQTGRPSVITEATVQKLEQALRRDYTVADACDTSGISRSTFYNRMRRDPVFRDRIALASRYLAIEARKNIFHDPEFSTKKNSDKQLKQWEERYSSLPSTPNLKEHLNYDEESRRTFEPLKPYSEVELMPVRGDDLHFDVIPDEPLLPVIDEKPLQPLP
jgi:uncharacterized protein YqkB